MKKTDPDVILTLRELTKKAGARSALSRRIGVTRSIVSMWLSGDAVIPPSRVEQIQGVVASGGL